MSKELYILVWLCFIITAVQMFLGTQVRESIDALTRLGVEREQWTEYLGYHSLFMKFLLVGIGIVGLYGTNERTYKYKSYDGYSYSQLLNFVVFC